MRIILLMPCRQAEKTLPSVLNALLRLNPQPDRYVFLENNSTDSTLQLIIKFPKPKEILRVWFREDALRFCDYSCDLVAIARDLLLRRARHLNSDFAVFLDSDIVVDSTDLISRLTSRDGDVVGGLCYWPAGRPLVASALWPSANPVTGGEWLRVPLGIGPCEEVLAVGSGCMCLNKRIIQDTRLVFYPVWPWLEAPDAPAYDNTDLSEDVMYCYKARYLGYRVLLDTTVETVHLPSGVLRPWLRQIRSFETVKAHEGLMTG